MSTKNLPQPTVKRTGIRRTATVLRKIICWSPFGERPWYFHLFNSLWVWATVILLFLSLPSWLGHTVNFPTQTVDPCDSPESGCYKELPDEILYGGPLQLGNGTCMVVTTREIVECP